MLLRSKRRYGFLPAAPVMLGIFFLAVFPVAAADPFLSVDFGTSASQPLQTGFENFGFNTSAFCTTNYARSEATDGTVDVSIEGQTHWRQYNAVTGGPYMALSNLLIDSALIVSVSGTAPNPTGIPMTLTLGDLKAGTYEITTYHHNTWYGAGTLMWYLTDASVTHDLKFTGLTTGLHNDSASSVMPTNITTVTQTFVSNGTDDILIKMYAVNPIAGGNQQVKINGFELSRVVPSGTLFVFE